MAALSQLRALCIGALSSRRVVEIYGYCASRSEFLLLESFLFLL